MKCCDDDHKGGALEHYNGSHSFHVGPILKVQKMEKTKKKKTLTFCLK